MTAFFFAWTDAGTPFDPAVHNREDEEIVSAKVEQLETEFANLSVDIRNPRIGLLNAGRKLWAWLSWDSGAGGIVPLFFGRVVGIPSNLHREIITLQFVARPENFGDQKALAASVLRELPYYDPVFIRPEMIDDPDVVLEGRTQVWHIDRVTHEVSVSDLLVGEDGTLEFQEDEVPYESVEISLDQPPVRAVAVSAEVSWTQDVAGVALPFLTDFYVPTLAAKGLIDGWPKPGDDLDGGWSVYSASAHSPYENMKDDDWGQWYLRGTQPGDPLTSQFGPPPFYMSVIQSYSASVSDSGAQYSSTKFAIINDIACLNLKLSYAAKRERKDIIQFTLIADSQPIVTMPDDSEVLQLSVAGNDVGMVIADPNLPSPLPPPPIGNAQRRSYFTTARGMASIQYVVQLARARIIARSRAVVVKWKCKLERAVEATLRKNGLLHDRRIPGGQALGKITGYAFTAAGGEIAGEITIACCIGYGGAIVPVEGAPCYASDGYMAKGYQAYDDQLVVLAASDVGFEPVRENPNDDGLIFPLRAAPIVAGPEVETIEKNEMLAGAQPTSQASTQVDDCGNTTSVSVSSSLDTGPYTNWLSGIETNVKFRIRAVDGGPFESIYPVNVTALKLPKQIDLEAPPS